MNTKPLFNLSLGVFAVMLLTTLPAHAAKKVKYVPPEGFAGHEWGELRTSFTACRTSRSVSARRG